MFPYSSRLNTHLTSRRISLFLAGTLAILTLSAMGGLLTSSAQAASTSCPATITSMPFALWGDTSSYSLVPGGSFETSPTGWTFSGGASRVLGSDPYPITGMVGLWSLGLPAGASAQSPVMCVEATERTYRFMAHSQGTEATIRPELVYETSLGTHTILGKQVTLKHSWEPSPILYTGALLVTAITGESAHLALRFTTLSGSAVIDDVFIDPRMRR